MSSSIGIQRFSPEVLEEIFAMLAPKDLISLAQTCTLFHKIINQSDQLWAKVCFNKFKIRVPRTNGFARRFYKNVLHKYGYLLGLWKEEVTFAGNLLQIKYCDGQLHGVTLKVSMYPARKLVSKPIFTISLDDEDRCLIKCFKKCCISKDSLLQSDINLQYIYKKLLLRDSASENPAPCWYLVMHSIPRCVRRSRHYSRLPFPRTATSSEAPIQPGLFTVTTIGIRGYPDMNDIRVCPAKSLVLVTYDEHWQIATGHQITVDENWYIQNGKFNFQADLHRCSYMDQEVRWDKDLLRQPSLMPDVYREKFNLPNDCLARVRETGVGCYGPGNYWIVFNQDSFGFRSQHSDQRPADWLRIYHRINDPLFLFSRYIEWVAD